MALTITKLKMWKDPGYTRGCLEVPPVGSKKLPTPDYVNSETLRPRKDSTLTALELPLCYSEVFDMSYLYMEAEDPSGSIALFGWIDSVQLIATGADAVRIDWTVDWWRTYSGDAVFGAGQITRCNNGSYKRPYQTRPRLKKIDKKHNIADRVPYFLICQSAKDQDGNISSFRYWFAPIGQQGENITIDMEDIYGGKIDELMNIDPESIIGIWISPFPLENFFDEKSWRVVRSPYAAWYSESVSQTGYITRNISSTFPNGIETTDTEEAGIIGPFGELQSILPWGLKLKETIRIDADISPESLTFYITSRYPDDEGSPADEISQGRFLKIECPNVPVNSNAFSSYMYSGQREYDKRSAEIQRNQQAVSGLSSITTSIIGGGIAGASKGPAGMAAGAAAGGIGSTIGTGVNYLASGWFNDELQAEKDKLYSNQASTLLKSGGGSGWLKLCGYDTDNRSNMYKIVTFKFDDVSLAEYTAQIQQNGYTVDIQAQNTSAFLNAGGPVQIQQQIVTGDIPPQAKQAIKDKLSAGVRIVERNSAGVEP